MFRLIGRHLTVVEGRIQSYLTGKPVRRQIGMGGIFRRKLDLCQCQSFKDTMKKVQFDSVAMFYGSDFRHIWESDADRRLQ